MDGEIKSKETHRTHGYYGFTRGKCWRYNPILQTLYWHENNHTENEDRMVIEHLEHEYGYEVKQQITLDGFDRDSEDYVKNFADAHGRRI